MKNGWTGGQYSMFRALFALYLLVHFLALLLRGEQDLNHSLPHGTVSALLAVGAVLSVLLGIGLYDRTAALGICCIGACLFASAPLLDNPSLLFVGWLLLVHLILPTAPYGSWAARGRVDPGGGWRMPPALFAATWIVLALGYTYSGCTKLANPSWRDGAALTLELVFAPLALVRRLRPWLWSLMLLMQLSSLAFLDFAGLSRGLLMVHLFAFDPGWIRPLSGGTERLFYDGHCGLCQRSVRLILAEDATGAAFRFAPLQGETFQARVSATEREALPLSLVVQTEKGALLTRSAGVLHILRRLGGLWRLLESLLALLPVRLRDRLYDGVARIRHRLFARPAELCPLMPPQLRARFGP